MNTDAPICTINAAYGDSNPAGLPVSVGVPFPVGTLTSTERLGVEAPDGTLYPAAGRSLVAWPDGSIRWCLVSFGARQPGPHRVIPELDSRPMVPSVSLTREEDRWILDSDRLHVVLAETGPGIFRELACDGQERLPTPEALHFRVDDATTLNETRRRIRVLEETPLRVRLRVEGAHFRPDGERRLHYRLDVEAWAGWPVLRLDYHYFHLEANRPSLRIERIAMDAEWKLNANTRRHFLQKNHGLFYVPRHVLNPAPVALVADTDGDAPRVEDPAMLLDDVDYPFYLHPPLVDTHEWLGVGDGDASVYVKVQDFARARPNRLFSDGRTLGAELWPAAAGPLDLPQGRSRRQAIVLAFPPAASEPTGDTPSGAPNQAPTGVAALLGAPLHEGRAAVDPTWIAQCGEFRQASALPFGKHVRIERNLHDLVRLEMPSTKFDVGDTDSHYARGITPLPGAPQLPRFFPHGTPTQTYRDLCEPVWTNNEYDAIHVFCSELMRTGRIDLWPTLRLAARHNIEVDFLHYSDHKWLHRATPAHSVRHTTTGAYPSHFWTQGLLEYYCLTGDPDAREVALALGDKTIENFADPEIREKQWAFNREIGWSILLLTCLVDITGEERFRPLLDEMVDFVIHYDRAAFRGAIKLSAGNDRQSMNRQIVHNFFGYASMMEGIDLYADITGRRDVAEWLAAFCRDLAEEAMNAARDGNMRGIDFGTALGIGIERTGDPRFLELTGLTLDMAYWNGPGVQGGGSAKPVAYAYRGLMRILGHAWRQGLLDPYEYPSMRKANRSTRDKREH